MRWHCERLQAWPGTQTTVDDTRGIEQVHVTGANWTLMNQTASGLEIEATNLQGGATVDLGVLNQDNQAIQDTHGFAVHPVGNASVQDLVLDVDWDPSSVDPPAQCPDGSGTPGTTDTTLVEWGLPVEHANVSMTTQRPFDHPSTPNWVKRVKTCKQDTLALELWGLEDVRFQRAPQDDSCKALTQVWVNTSRARDTDLRLIGFNCENGDQEDKRVKIHPLPTTFWIKTPVPPWFPSPKPGAVFKSSEVIDQFEYATNGCLLVTEAYEPKSDAHQILGVDEGGEAFGRGIGCATASGARAAGSAAESGIARAGGLVASGLQGAKKIVLKVSDGSKRYVDGVWHDIQGNLTERWDIDGHSGQRDQPRFTHLDGAFRSHRLEVRNTQDDRGAVLDLTQFANQGGVSVDAQGQCYTTPQASPSNTLVPGTISLPDAITEKQCLEWNTTADPNKCEEWETWEEVQERVAKTYFQDKAKFADGQWETIPWNAWTEAIR